MLGDSPLEFPVRRTRAGLVRRFSTTAARPSAVSAPCCPFKVAAGLAKDAQVSTVISQQKQAAKAPVMEVFRSIQGEGLYVGEPQVLVRLRGCPLRCNYCDTPHSWALAGSSGEAPDPATPIPGTDGFAKLEEWGEAGWLTPFQVTCAIASVEDGRRRTISLTGGEPLLWPEFIAQFRSFLEPRRLHLETAGAHPKALAKVVELCDHISLDLKLPGDLAPPKPFGAKSEGSTESKGDVSWIANSIGEQSATRDSQVKEAPARERSFGGPDVPSSEPVPTSAAEWSEVRREVLGIVRERDACAKLVLTAQSSLDEVECVANDLLQFAPDLPVYVQPASRFGSSEVPSAARVLQSVEIMLERNLTCRVVPQVHRHLNLP